MYYRYIDKATWCTHEPAMAAIYVAIGKIGNNFI